MEDLYAVLGVSPTASPGEITKAYRLLVLRLHPDKNNGQATERFHSVQAAYETLRDPKKRRAYDSTGATGEEPMAASVITPEDIEALHKVYPGSEDEKDDLRGFYECNGGDVSKIFEWIPFAEPSRGAAERLLRTLDEMITVGEISITPQFEKSKPKLLKAIPRLEKQREAETKRFEEEHISFEDLAKQIAANRERRAKAAQKTIKALEAKYGAVPTQLPMLESSPRRVKQASGKKLVSKTKTATPASSGSKKKPSHGKKL